MPAGIALIIAALPSIVTAIREAVATWKLAQESGAPDQIVGSALSVMRHTLAAGMKIRDAIQQWADAEGIVVPGLVELTAVIDEVEARPDKDVEG